MLHSHKLPTRTDIIVLGVMWQGGNQIILISLNVGASSLCEGIEDYVGLETHPRANVFLLDPNTPLARVNMHKQYEFQELKKLCHDAKKNKLMLVDWMWCYARMWCSQKDRDSYLW